MRIFRACSTAVNQIHRILQDIPIKIRIAAVKENGILGCPSSRFGVIVARPKARQLRVRVMQAASKAKRLKARPAVFNNPPPGVIVQLLRNFSRLRVDDLPHAAQVVADDQVALVCPEHGRGHVAFVCVQVDASQSPVLIRIGNGAQAVLVDQPVLQLAVLLFAYVPVERVDQVFDLRAIGQGDQAQVAQAVVGVMGDCNF